jgi:hypothetical protein
MESMITYLCGFIGGCIFMSLIRKKESPKNTTLKNGDKILITYLKPCRNGNGTRNPYIGMSGTVYDLTTHDFSLLTDTSWLVFIDLKTTKYKHI